MKNLLILLACITITTSFAKPKTLPQLELGQVPPNYLGKDSKGNKILVEDNKGKMIIITFWASWCSPCRKELPVLENIQRKMGKDNVKVVAINFKEGDKKYRMIRRKLKDLDLTITRDKYGSIAKKFGAKTIPNLFIIDKTGVLVYHAVGYGKNSINKLVKAINRNL